MNTTINFNDLGLGNREAYRLIAFMQWFAKAHENDNIIEYDFGYDLHYDEPFIIVNAFSKVYATDFNLAYDDNFNIYLEV